MINLTQTIGVLTDLFRMCVHCGASLIRYSDKTGTSGICCEFCNGKLQNSKNQTSRSEYEHEVLSLYSWDKLNDQLIRNIVKRGIKGGGAEKAVFDFYAEKLCIMSSQKESAPREMKLLVVPAPGRRGGAADHAEKLARSVAAFAAGEYWSGLERCDDKEQKRKTEKQRRAALEILRIKPGCTPPGADTHERQRIVFIDDIITTGETAHSAYLALGKPKHFEIWTIFNRIRLRVQRPFDITRC